LPTAQILCRLRAAFGPFNQSGPTAAFSKLESASATGGYVNGAKVIAARRFSRTRSPDHTRRCFLSFYKKGTIMIETIEAGFPMVVGLKLCSKLQYFFRSAVDAAWNWLRNNPGNKNTKRAVRPLRVREKPDLWSGYPWFGI
jgi:hypothetical protein